MTEALVDSYNEVILNGIPLKTRGPVADTNLSVFGGKVVTGDYTKDSNPTLSAWVTSDLSGGLGVEDANEGVDQNRYLIGTLYPRFPNMISRAYKVKSISDDDAAWATAIGGKAPRFLSDILVSGTWQGIVAFDTAVWRLSSTRTGSWSWTAGGSLPPVPTWNCCGTARCTPNWPISNSSAVRRWRPMCQAPCRRHRLYRQTERARTAA